LAIDTALELCSACVFDTKHQAVLASESLLMERGHAEALMPLVERVIGAVEGGFSSIDRVAASIGPGSFTGLRVGLAAGRAIAVAANLPVVGIDTLSAFAVPYIKPTEQRFIASVIDARHSHVYFQLMRPDGSVMVEPCIIPLIEAAALIGDKPVRIVGSATSLLAEAVSNKADLLVEESLRGADIVEIARLGALADPANSPPKPLYLRPPDAMPQLNGRIARA
jgi:tRNA threonylcarbamoyladenosine biosynthesis protein TsaB